MRIASLLALSAFALGAEAQTPVNVPAEPYSATPLVTGNSVAWHVGDLSLYPGQTVTLPPHWCARPYKSKYAIGYRDQVFFTPPPAGYVVVASVAEAEYNRFRVYAGAQVLADRVNVPTTHTFAPSGTQWGGWCWTRITVSLVSAQ